MWIRVARLLGAGIAAIISSGVTAGLMQGAFLLLTGDVGSAPLGAAWILFYGGLVIAALAFLCFGLPGLLLLRLLGVWGRLPIVLLATGAGLAMGFRFVSPISAGEYAWFAALSGGAGAVGGLGFWTAWIRSAHPLHRNRDGRAA